LYITAIDFILFKLKRHIGSSHIVLIFFGAYI